MSSPSPLEPTALSQLLRARREALGYSRPQVAAATGVTESALDTYEHGVRPRIDTAIRLARFLGIALEELADAVGVPMTPAGAEPRPQEMMTKARMDRGWTVERMGRELGVSAHEVAAYERGDLEVTVGILSRVIALPRAGE